MLYLKKSPSDRLRYAWCKPCPSLASGWLLCHLTGAEPEEPEVTLVKSTHEYNVDGPLCFCFCLGNSHGRSRGGFVNVFLCSNRAEEMNSSQLTELEDDIQQQLGSTEERVRQEVRVARAAPILFI